MVKRGQSGRRPDSRRLLDGELSRRILVLDGATGTFIQALGLSEEEFRGGRYAGHPCDLSGNYDLLCLSRPEAVSQVHRAYLEAGADIISTNTLNANRISQSDYWTEDDVSEINLEAARLALAAAAEFTSADPTRPRFVAGVMGPTNKTCSISSDPEDPARREITFDEIADVYREQAAALIQGGVDVLMLETVFDTLCAKAALFAISTLLEERGLDLPVWVSATVLGAGGRMLSGQTVEAFWTSIAHARPFCVGLNCGLGAEALGAHLAALGRVADTLVSVHPNAGLPDESGEYHETPEIMASSIGEFARAGLVNVVGGCCGTKPEHIVAIAAAVAGLAPRRVPELPVYCRLSGLESMEIRQDSLFVNVGERTNITGSARFARLIREGHGEEALQVAREQLRAGAQIIDVNMDDPLLDSAAEMSRFLNLVASDPEIAAVPVMLDSARWEVLEAGLKCLQGKGAVNSLSLKDGEEEFIRRARLVRKYGAAVVVMAFDEEGQAESYERKVEVCSRAYGILTQRVGFPTEDIIVDPAIFAVGTGLSGQERGAISFIEACRTLKRTLPHCLVSGGVSNLSFAFRGNNFIRGHMHTVFLYHAIRAGMDMGIVNAGQLGVYEEIPREIRDPIEDLILDRRPDALKRVMEIAVRTRGGRGEAEAGAEPDWRRAPVAERIKYALVSGVTDYIEEDTLSALKEIGEPLDVIEGPLMEGMKVVGDLFGAGKMFLPQVIRSARVMKMAVSALMPRMDERGGGGRGRGRTKVLLATVYGDVHDIGKNIVALVLSCNNCEVVDLGAKVPAGQIADAVERERPDVIGLSGLITPSLDQMVHVLRELGRRSIATPVMVGGAATSRAHTALKIDPEYDGAVVHVRDASRVAGAVEALAGPRPRSVSELKAEHARVRSEIVKRRGSMELLPLEEARRRRARPSWKDYRPMKPNRLGVTVLEDYPLEEAVGLIDWNPLFRAYKLEGRYPDILSSRRVGAEARELLAEAESLLRRIVGERLLAARAAVGLFAARAVGDDIEIYVDERRSRLVSVLQCLRQQTDSGEGRPCMSLADFVADVESGVQDYIGGFAVSAGFGCRELALRFEREGDYHTAVLVKVLAHRLAQACAEHLHREVRRDLWGYAPDEDLDFGEIVAGKFVGIRPAPGYPACPDHTTKGMLFELIEAERRIGVTLTETFAMEPAASTAGWYFAHPESRYFRVGRIGRDQAADYARRKGMSLAEAERWLASCLE